MTGFTDPCPECGGAVTVVHHSDLGDRGPLTIECAVCPWEFYVPAETTARSRITACRQIVREHAARRVEGYLVDATTAAALVAVYDALSPASREKFGVPSLPRLVDFTWQHVKAVP